MSSQRKAWTHQTDDREPLTLAPSEEVFPRRPGAATFCRSLVSGRTIRSSLSLALHFFFVLELSGKGGAASYWFTVELHTIRSRTSSTLNHTELHEDIMSTMKARSQDTRLSS